MEKKDLKELIKKTSILSKLDIQKNNLDDYFKKAQSIISFVEQLNELNTDNIKPMSHAFDVKGSLREDLVSDPNCYDKILENAPERENNFFVVPRVIDSH